MSVLKIKQNNEWVTVNSPLSQELPLSIANGGTGASSAAGMVANQFSTSYTTPKYFATMDDSYNGGKTAFSAVKAGFLSKTYQHNYLDNSDFRNPVNQKGYQNGSSAAAYEIFIDRWHNASTTAQPYYLSKFGLSMPAESTIVQYFDSIRSGDTYTFAIGLTNGDVHTVHGIFSFSEDNSWLRCAITNFTGGHVSMETYQGHASVAIYASVDITVMWAAVYAGEFNATELPEYQPKGYGAELAECQRYFLRFPSGAYGTGHYLYGRGLVIPISTPVAMRAKPTLSLTTAQFFASSPSMAWYSLTNSTIYTISESQYDLAFTGIGGATLTYGSSYLVNITGSLSAEI